MPIDAPALADEIERQRPSLVGLLASLSAPTRRILRATRGAPST